MRPLPLLALTQGDPAGIGPEILLRLALSGEPGELPFRPLLLLEEAAANALKDTLPDLAWDRLTPLPSPDPEALAALPAGAVPFLDPVREARAVQLGEPGAADAHGAMAALDQGVKLAEEGVADALVTAPLAKSVVARHVLPGFVGHTDYLAERQGLTRYGRDYLMAFLAPDLQVALLSTHVPLTTALEHVRPENLGEALDCLHRHAGGKIAVAGLNPHAGEGGLLGGEDDTLVRPAVTAARERGIDAHGPESADSLFARSRHGEFDWVLALYHDQGLIAVKTAAFGLATNWTLGLPYLRTSVDHGTAYAIAGRGLADERPLAAAVRTTLSLLSGEMPRKRAADPAPGRGGAGTS